MKLNATNRACCTASCVLADNGKVAMLHCGHLFCTECIESALEADEKCPCCKQVNLCFCVDEVQIPKGSIWEKDIGQLFCISDLALFAAQSVEYAAEVSAEYIPLLAELLSLSDASVTVCKVLQAVANILAANNEEVRTVLFRYFTVRHILETAKDSAFDFVKTAALDTVRHITNVDNGSGLLEPGVLSLMAHQLHTFDQNTSAIAFDILCNINNTGRVSNAADCGNAQVVHALETMINAELKMRRYSDKVRKGQRLRTLLRIRLFKTSTEPSARMQHVVSLLTKRPRAFGSN